MSIKFPQKSMIYAMKDHTNNALEADQAASASSGFEALFLEHWPRVYHLLCGLVGDPAEAEDLALETFLRLYQRHLSLDKDFNLGGWLHRVAANLGLHSIRGFQRRERYEMDAGKRALDDAPEERPAELLAQEEERRLVRLVLSRMKEGQSQLLVMRYSGMSYKEIAKALGLSPTSIGPLLVRAEREFEKRYRALVEEEI